MTQPAIQSPRRPRPSATAAPKFTVQPELLADVAGELPPLFVRYGKEIDKAPADPDWQGLLRMTAVDMLKLVTARFGGTLVGFCFSNIGRHIMYKSTPHGITFAVWLDPAYRTGWNGYRLLRFNRDFLHEIGCKRLCLATDVGNPRLGKIYERLGYKLDELSYASMT
jgi:GNAT superfamily N-acetyltransferase